MTDKSEYRRLQPITFLIDQKGTNKNRASFLQPVFNFSYEGISVTVVNIHINQKKIDRIQQLTYSTVEFLICTQAIIYSYSWFTRR